MNTLLRRAQQGFSVVELLVIVAIVGVIGGAGYYVYSNQSDDSAKKTENSQTVSEDGVPAAPAINDTKDLDAANQALDETDLDASDADTAELDSNLADI